MEQKLKLAGDLKVGDRILWDGVPATVTAKQNYLVAMLPGMQTELVVNGTLDDGQDFTAAWAGNAGDAVALA